MKIKNLILLLFVYQNCYSQYNSNKNIKGTLIEQNLNPNFISLSLPFISFESITANSNLFADAGLDFKFNKILFNGKYRYNYGDNTLGSHYNYQYYSIYKPENSQSYNLRLGYIFNTKEVEKSINFHLKTLGNTEYTAYSNVPMTKFKSINLGFSSGFTFYAGGFSSFKFNSLNNESLMYVPISTKVTTYLEYSTISLGVSSGHYGYWKVDLDGYGKREAQKFSSWYINTLILAKAKLDDINIWKQVNENYIYQRVSINESKLTRFGICGGYNLQDFNKFGLSAKIETGIYPGVSGNIFGRLGLTIASNIQISKLFK